MLFNTVLAVVAAWVTLQNPGGSVREPGFRYVGSTACSDLSAYAFSQDLTEQLGVTVDLKKLGLKVGESRRWDLSAVDPATVSVRVALFDSSPLVVVGCSDLGAYAKAKIEWRARSGVITVSLAQLLKDEGEPPMYAAIVTLDRVVFEGPGGLRVNAAGPIVLTGRGGWLPG